MEYRARHGAKRPPAMCQYLKILILFGVISYSIIWLLLQPRQKQEIQHEVANHDYAVEREPKALRPRKKQGWILGDAKWLECINDETLQTNRLINRIDEKPTVILLWDIFASSGRRQIKDSYPIAFNDPVPECDVDCVVLANITASPSCASMVDAIVFTEMPRTYSLEYFQSPYRVAYNYYLNPTFYEIPIDIHMSRRPSADVPMLHIPKCPLSNMVAKEFDRNIILLWISDCSALPSIAQDLIQLLLKNGYEIHGETCGMQGIEQISFEDFRQTIGKYTFAIIIDAMASSQHFSKEVMESVCSNTITVYYGSRVLDKLFTWGPEIIRLEHQSSLPGIMRLLDGIRQGDAINYYQDQEAEGEILGHPYEDYSEETAACRLCKALSNVENSV